MEAKQLWGVTYEENICEKMMMCVKNIIARVYRNASLHMMTLVGIHGAIFLIRCSGSNLSDYFFYSSGQNKE